MALRGPLLLCRIPLIARHLRRSYAAETIIDDPIDTVDRPARAITSHFVEVDGVSIHYDKAGVGKNTVLLLPGGLGCPETDFQQQLNHFNRDMFTLIAWSPRGYGYSRPMQRQWDDFLANDAEDAAKMMQVLKIPRYSLVGWSDGGITSMIMASRYPERIQKMVLIGANAFVSQEDVELIEAIGAVETWSDRMRKPFEKVYGEDFQKLWSEYQKSFGSYLRNNGGEICDKDLHKITCPTLVIHGKKDPLVPVDHALNIVEKIKDAKLHIFEEGKHNVHMRYYKEFNSLVEQFLIQQ